MPIIPALPSSWAGEEAGKGTFLSQRAPHLCFPKSQEAIGEWSGHPFALVLLTSTPALQAPPSGHRLKRGGPLSLHATQGIPEIPELLRSLPGLPRAARAEAAEIAEGRSHAPSPQPPLARAA